MKTPNSTKAESSVPATGAQIIAAGTLPIRHATLTAEVLFRLLNGEYMTSLGAVSEASTTRLAAVIEYIKRTYNWPIQCRDKAAGCCDGRVSWVGEYWIDSEVIALAAKSGARQWQTKVRKARAALRTKAVEAERMAARANEAIRHAAKARGKADQFDFFEDLTNG